MFDMEEDLASENVSQKKINTPKPANKLSLSGPMMINSLNPLSATSPLATLMTMSKDNAQKENMRGGGNGTHPQPHQDPMHPGMFVVNIPGKKQVRGKYSKIAKVIREYEHSLNK
jgi:hypothetical protein